ncbi:MAG: hypothetical protein K6G10_10230 [Butyrivibrio sp.]|nr:hypothetical protein [Butyrivibrio sp.]
MNAEQLKASNKKLFLLSVIYVVFIAALEILNILTQDIGIPRVLVVLVSLLSVFLSSMFIMKFPAEYRGSFLIILSSSISLPFLVFAEKDPFYLGYCAPLLVLSLLYARCGICSYEMLIAVFCALLYLVKTPLRKESFTPQTIPALILVFLSCICTQMVSARLKGPKTFENSSASASKELQDEPERNLIPEEYYNNDTNIKNADELSKAIDFIEAIEERKNVNEMLSKSEGPAISDQDFDKAPVTADPEKEFVKFKPALERLSEMRSASEATGEIKQTSIVDKSDNISLAESDSSADKALIAELSDILDKTEREIATYKEKVDELTAVNERLFSENQQLAALNAKLEDRSNILEARSSELETRNSGLESENNDLKSINSGLEVTNQELEADRNTLLEEKEKLKALISENLSQTRAGIDVLFAFKEKALEIVRSTQSTASANKEVAEKMDELLSFSGTIMDLSKESSVLALSASIEASRAGELGQGFAKVAGDVRDMSEKSAEFFTELSGHLNALSESIKSTSSCAEASVHSVSGQHALIKDIENAMGSITEISEHLNRLV